MRYQIENDGSISQAETELLVDQKIILTELFEQFSWNVIRIEKNGAKYAIDIQNSHSKKILKLNVFTGNIRDESRNEKEKKIQLNGSDPRIIEENRINIVLGIYCRHNTDSLKDLIFAGWSVDKNTNYPSNPSIRGLTTDLIQSAKIVGFVKHEFKSKYVCIFRPEFIFYYIENISNIHNVNITRELVSSVGINDTNNTIYFGSPGTGKSHKVNEILEPLNKQFYERITFHPDYDNASFIGGYKPVSDEKGDIKYKFVPQVFTNIYVKAWEDLENAYFLAIEEINRGNCAEIFGEIFQLLDRNSRYTVSPSNELKNYLVEQLGEMHEGIKDGLKLPVNLSLLATMNTSDQSLFPMDSAFKRRWDWEYMPICYKEFDEEEQPNNSFNFLVKIDKNSSFRWIDFIKAVNDRIKMNENLGMDKCIGNYFIKPKNQEISLKEFINKAIFYLWNDVFKDEDENNSIFAKGDFYEDFFPIQSRGIELVTKLIESLSIDIITSEDIE